jgi:hypothetical protein
LSAPTNQASITTQKKLADYGKQQNPGHVQHETLLLLLLLQRRNREQGKAIAEEEHAWHASPLLLRRSNDIATVLGTSSRAHIERNQQQASEWSRPLLAGSGFVGRFWVRV